MEALAEREDNTSGVLGGNLGRVQGLGRDFSVHAPSLHILFSTSLREIAKNIANFATRIISSVKEITVGQCSGPVCDKGARRGKSETKTYLMEVKVPVSSREN